MLHVPPPKQAPFRPQAGENHLNFPKSGYGKIVVVLDSSFTLHLIGDLTLESEVFLGDHGQLNATTEGELVCSHPTAKLGFHKDIFDKSAFTGGKGCVVGGAMAYFSTEQDTFFFNDSSSRYGPLHHKVLALCVGSSTPVKFGADILNSEWWFTPEQQARIKEFQRGLSLQSSQISHP